MREREDTGNNYQLSDLSHFRVSSIKRGSTGRSKVEAVSRDAEFEVPVRHVSRDGLASSCLCGSSSGGKSRLVI